MTSSSFYNGWDKKGGKCGCKCSDSCCFISEPCQENEDSLRRTGDANVQITSQWFFTARDQTTLPDTIGTNRADIQVHSNGFFVRTAGGDWCDEHNFCGADPHRYIVTPASAIMAPPTLSSGTRTYPFAHDAPTADLIGFDALIRAHKIYVSVHNVKTEPECNKNRGCTAMEHLVYQATFIGVDPSGDTALLRIYPEDVWNRNLPLITTEHPFLPWGDNRKAAWGEKAYIVGSIASNFAAPSGYHGSNQLSTTSVAHNRYLDHSGWIHPELVLVDAPVYSHNAGSPILNSKGQVIAMQTMDVTGSYDPFYLRRVGAGAVGGPSTFFMCKMLMEFIKALHRQELSEHVEIIKHPSGAFFRYLKGYLGVGYRLMSPNTLSEITEFSQTAATRRSPQFLLDDIGPGSKQMMGAVVLSLAGHGVTGITGATGPNAPDGILYTSDAAFFVPGAVRVTNGSSSASPFPILLDSPLLTKLFPGDIITHIQRVPLGDIGTFQVAPALLLRAMIPGKTIASLTVRRAQPDLLLPVSPTGATGATGSTGPAPYLADEEEILEGIEHNYDQVVTINQKVKQFPRFLDHPWYAAHRFPSLTETSGYPNFTFNMSQDTTLQYPQLLTRGLFHPPI